MEAQLHQTREAWLSYVAQRMAAMFEKFRAPLPAQLRIAIGFTSSGRRSRSIGECWDNQCSEDRHFEIFIRPDLCESKDLLPMQVATILGQYTPRLVLRLATARPSGEYQNIKIGEDFKGYRKSITARVIGQAGRLVLLVKNRQAWN